MTHTTRTDNPHDEVEDPMTSLTAPETAAPATDRTDRIERLGRPPTASDSTR